MCVRVGVFYLLQFVQLEIEICWEKQLQGEFSNNSELIAKNFDAHT